MPLWDGNNFLGGIVMWLYYLVPIAIQLILLPFWFIDKGAIVSLIGLAIGAVMTPIYLIIISFKFVEKISAGSFVGILLLMIGIAILACLINYFNWGLSAGNLLSPDSETVLIIKMQMVVSSAIVIVGWIVAFIIKSKTM